MNKNCRHYRDAFKNFNFKDASLYFLDALHIAGLSDVYNENQIKLYLKYLDLVLSENKKINLTNITKWQDGIILHLIDSLLYDSYISQSGKFIDIGTGAGFPGIPLLISSANRNGLLIDSIGKKIKCVSYFLKELNLSDNGIALHTRVEELDNKEYITDFVVARAVSSLPTLLEYASPLLPVHGKAVFSKGKLNKNELEAGNKAAKICGLILKDIHYHELPHNLGKRCILIYDKCNEPEINLPRRVGMAHKKPLA